MPQMAPMSWLMLYTTFCMTLMAMSAINYYIYTPEINKMSSELKNMKSMNWKW